MKNKKSVLICFAILALLCLGIGFATLVDNLAINATVSGSGAASDVEEEIEEAFDVQFFGVGADKSREEIVVSFLQEFTDDGDEHTITITDMKAKGDTVTLVYDIKALVLPDGYKAVLSADATSLVPGDTNTVTQYSVTTSFDTTDLTTVEASAKLTVVITLNETLVESNDVFSLTGSVKVKATAVANS